MYNGNRTGGGGVLGKFPYPPFFWWLSGASWDGMLHYWLYTGDESYYNVTWDALVSQISDTNNYLPLSEKFDEVCVAVLYNLLQPVTTLTASHYGTQEGKKP
jgi:rhamnogalacturonyl hydrolase YesR